MALSKAQKSKAAATQTQRWEDMELLESRLLLSAWYVAANYHGTETGTTTQPYNTIQEAIDAAEDGDTVNVGNGTYAGDLLIDMPNLTIQSIRGASGTIIQGVGQVDSASGPLAVPNIDIRANGTVLSGFTISSPAAEVGFYSSGIVIDALNVEIKNNIFRTASAANSSDISQAIQTYRDDNGPNQTDLSGLNIHNNTFTSFGPGVAGFEAIYINHTLTDPAPTGTVTVADNTINGKVVRGITSERSKTIITGNSISTTLAPRALDDATPGGTLQGINVKDYNGRAQADVDILANTVGGSKASTGFNVAIRIGDAIQALTNFDILNNILAWNNTGVQVNDSADEVNIMGNSFHHNTLSVDNNDAAILDASGNWWGSKVAATVAAAVSGPVDYTPWLGVGTDTATKTAGFQGNFSTLYVDDTTQAGATGRIAEALALVTGSAPTIYVAGGSYAEDLWLDKAGLVLVGAGRATTTVLGQTDRADFGQGGNVVVDAANVSISGFTFVGADTAADRVNTVVYLKGRAGATPMNLKLFNNEIRSRASTVADGAYDVNGIETDYGNLSGVQIYGNRFTGTPEDGYSGIYINGAVNGGNVTARGHLVIRDNTFLGNVQRAIAVETSYTDILRNTIVTNLPVANTYSGIQIRSGQPAGSNAANKITIQSNVVSGFTCGLKLGMNVAIYGVDQNLTDVVVKSNVILGGTTGVLVMSGAENVKLSGNQFVGMTGLAVSNTDGDLTAILNAKSNWWGDATGPFNATGNPDALGEAVGNRINFSPWKTA